MKQNLSGSVYNRGTEGAIMASYGMEASPKCQISATPSRSQECHSSDYLTHAAQFGAARNTKRPVRHQQQRCHSASLEIKSWGV
eukprot:5186106-Amphidinium_carterae.1